LRHKALCFIVDDPDLGSNFFVPASKPRPDYLNQVQSSGRSYRRDRKTRSWVNANVDVFVYR
jgi:siroheme synthase (precorrin-2 oxidase/ferrochelatase)